MKGHASESWIEERKTMILESKNFNVNTGPIYVTMGLFYFSFDRTLLLTFTHPTNICRTGTNLGPGDRKNVISLTASTFPSMGRYHTQASQR